MAARRIAPLIALVALGAVALVLRLYQLQIHEHSTWSAEAAGLVRSGAIRPYTRGAILDRAGRVLRSDRTSFRLEFVYREFRRRHPLGIVAHARAALRGVAGSLEEAWGQLEPWAEALLALSPEQLDAFARGAPLEAPALRVPACDTPELEARPSRRADARFYLTALLELSREERRELTRLARERPELSWLELGAAARKVTPERVRTELFERLRVARTDLEALALLLASERAANETSAAAEAPAADSATERLVWELDQHRERVDDSSASALFREAAGFGVHRIEPQILLEHVDLSWVCARLGWDLARAAQWLEREREDYRRLLASGLPERLAAQVELDARRPDAPLLLVERWLAPFASVDDLADALAAREPLQVVVRDELSAFVEFDERDFEASAPRVAFEEALGALAPDAAFDWSVVARLELGPNAHSEELAAAAREWSEAFDGRFEREFVRARSAGVLARWEQELQSAVLAVLSASAPGAPGEVSAPRRWPVRAERLEKVDELARFVLKDQGNRPRAVLTRPSYALTHLLTRHRDRFAGFVVADTHERTARLGRDGEPIARALIGAVGAPTYQEELAARELRDEFRSLARKGVRAQEDAQELAWLAHTLTRPDELRGRGGIEGYFDRELSGRNGYRETRGLQDLIDGSFELDVPPVDGLDLTLTLDLDLQEAAAECLAAPEGPPDPPSADYAWLARPTGAIVLMRVDGSVLAAASHPTRPRGEDGRASVADEPWERTLRKPGFQPPGSSFKPFVAAWALDQLAGTDPRRLLECAMLPDGRGAGYVDVRCNVRHGHGAVDLRDALKRSCNSYFAMLGERFETDDWRALAAEFGFGEPSGVRALGRRPGLSEDSVPRLFERELVGREPRLAGNGLAVVELTPMQLARATAGLATGWLPQARLVERIGANVLEPSARELSLSPAALDFVREAMEACANEAGGSAHEALSEAELGWRLAAKTGSADISTERVETADGQSRVRKHTWLIGYFPAHEPRYVVVVFCHDTLQTASHSSIWLARQFLRTKAVREFVASEAQR